ncbi:putative Nuclear transcription factor Y subunit gamma [Hypsibius exemplaris]|uniref:Nuclear transcription factor Y subunit gamma n=1 Tax=Hypsibius exemplaris TaxID=2072580 RepID=A0A1W0X6C1_HYPEX|nr:putative Nuclear transcription factor Y subunit gamma [Hypsibius exemplaris]
MSSGSGVTFTALAQSLANLPSGSTIVSQDGTSISLDNNQQLVIQSAGGAEETVTRESSAEQQLRTFWQRQTDKIRSMRPEEFRHQELPLARIKKIMKLDEDVGMISSEAPVVLSKACEMFIEELTLRAWLHVEENKRRTLQRNDVATAVSKCDQFDFLIDIVPRDEVKPKPTTKNTPRSVSEVQYYVQQGGAASSLPSAGTGDSQPERTQTLPIMVNGPGGDVQQANLNLSANQLEAIRNYITQLGIPITSSNQIVIQAPTQGGNQLQVSLNSQQLNAQNSSDTE